MAVCTSNTETITATNYTDSYLKNASTGTKSVLPGASISAPGGWTTTTAPGGTVPTATMTTYINTILGNSGPFASAAAPLTASNTDTSPAQTFATNAATLRTAINNEYCFYYVRYKYGLTQVLNNSTAAGVASTSGTQTQAYTDQATLIANVITINTTLNYIIQIMQGLVNSRTTILGTYYKGADINSVNTALTTARNNLIANSAAIQSNSLAMDTKQAMIDYTLEKNKSSRNLLGVYIFMNIVAGGLLFYLYKNSNK